ncbi:unnamed protein product [Agarophyton chilense]
MSSLENEIPHIKMLLKKTNQDVEAGIKQLRSTQDKLLEQIEVKGRLSSLLTRSEVMVQLEEIERDILHHSYELEDEMADLIHIHRQKRDASQTRPQETVPNETYAEDQQTRRDPPKTEMPNITQPKNPDEGQSHSATLIRDYDSASHSNTEKDTEPQNWTQKPKKTVQKNRGKHSIGICKHSSFIEPETE